MSERKDLYGSEDISSDAQEAIPGVFPFRRGIYSTMHTSAGHLWTMRQFAGFDTAEETNKRFQELLAIGQTGLSIAFDMPTLLGLDSSSPESLGEVGKGGVAVDTLDDMERLFIGIDPREVSTSMTINAPAIVLLAMYYELARKRAIPLTEIRGTIQNDPLKEFIAQNEWIVPPSPSVKLLTDIVEYSAEHAPQFNPVSISGYHIREAGSDAVQEVAFTLADGIAYVDACLERGMDIDAFAPRLSFFFDFCNDFIEEIAKIRAARVLWARIIKDRYGSNNLKSQFFRVHIQTSGHSLTREQPSNNIIRTALQALGAVLAGCQSLHTNSYDEQLSLPSREAVTIALRTQQIIAYETGVTQFVDPLGGSYAVESVTEEIIKEAQKYITHINEMGGMIAAVEAGWPQAQIMETAATYQRAVEKKDIVVIGQNMFADEAVGDFSFAYNVDAEQKQIGRLENVKARRNGAKVKQALGRIKRDAQAGRNCMPAVCKAVSEYATVEEICKALQDVYGVYREEDISF